MPLIETRGAASARGFGAFVQGAAPVFVEDVMSVFLYTGNGATQTITNEIDLSGKGGLVWIKRRSGAIDHALYDTARGTTKDLVSNSTSAETTQSTGLTAFSSTGFSIGDLSQLNASGATYVSWTFRKQPKFFDVVTWTGNGSVPRSIPHSLGSIPGCIITKCTSSSGYWITRHQSVGSPTNDMTQYALTDVLYLDRTVSADGSSNIKADATNITVNHAGDLNANGQTYVAYLFAHNAGGFGLSGTDNVISCGSYTTTGGGTNTINLGWEPQWLLVKRATNSNSDPNLDSWHITDNMRGMTAFDGAGSTSAAELRANASNGEESLGDLVLTATGFEVGPGNWNSSTAGTYIYIAIRRGPMRVPTSGTSVFGLNARTGTGADATVTGGQTDDAVLIKNRGSAIASLFSSRLTRNGNLSTSNTAAESVAGTTILQDNPWDVMDGVKVGTTSDITNASGNTFINYLFRRAPGFFDVVCYTGTGVNRTVNHNLGVVPELMIVKRRDTTADWWVYDAATDNTKYQVLNSTATPTTSSTAWNNTIPTSSVFTVGTGTPVNASAGTYVAYLFASCPGVSKVGSYTGTGNTLQINCGFTAGARFVLIKRTDSTGDWYVWDTARGIVAGNDPYILLNSAAAEVTNTDYIDTYSLGFEISSTAPAAINANGGTFIFLAVA